MDWIRFGSRGRIHHAVVAALNARMILVARDQQNGVGIAIGVRAVDSNFSAIVNVKRDIEVESGVGRDQAVQIDTGAVLPQSCRIRGAVTGVRASDDLTARVDERGKAAPVAGQRPEVRHPALLPKDRVLDCVARKIRPAHNRPFLVNPVGEPERTPKGAQVGERPVVP